MLRIRDPRPSFKSNPKKRCLITKETYSLKDRHNHQKNHTHLVNEHLNPSTRGCYVSSGSFSGQVTYLTTEETRTSVVDIAIQQDIKPLNLCAKQQSFFVEENLNHDPHFCQEFDFSDFQNEDFEYFHPQEEELNMLTSQRRHQSVDGASFGSSQDCFGEEESAGIMSPAQDLRVSGKIDNESPAESHDDCRTPFSDLSFENNSESDNNKTYNDQLSENNDSDLIANDVGEDLSVKHRDSNLMQAKRARVENIVFNIRENPKNSSTVDDVTGVSNDEERNSPRSDILYSGKSRKRKMSEKIRELQNEIEKIKSDYQNDSTDEVKINVTSSANQSQRIGKNKIDNIVQEVRSPGEFISQALGLVDQQRNSEDDWEDKRSGVNDESRPAKNKKDFCGEIKVTFPGGFSWTGANNEKAPVAYEVLVETLKRELSSAVEKIAERSAKRVLEELELKAFNRQETWDNHSYPESDKNQKYKLKLKRSNLNLYDKDRQGISAEEENNSQYENEAGVTLMHTKSISQMCCSDLQVRRKSFADNDEKKSARSYPDLPAYEDNLPSPTDPVRNNKHHDLNERSPSSERSQDEDEQTQPLPLVTKKTNSFSLPSSPENNLSHRQTPPLQPFIRSPSIKTNHHEKSVRSTPYERRNTVRRPNYAIPAYNPFVERPQPFPSSFFQNYSSNGFSSFRNTSKSENFMMPAASKVNPFSPHIKPPPLVPVPPFPAVRSSLYSSHPSTTLGSYPFPFPMHTIGAIEKLRRGMDLASKPTRTGSKSIGSSSSGSLRTDGYRNSPADFSPCSMASIQEGLTPQHLKKAKLMFFYTRYPSANTLKTYFSDVKFSRAITSQLIKWFSNFREFYYIQMEKFSRQALTDGFSQVEHINVDRESELFRVLNIHYNKSNDFRVPEKFISVTRTSLQEFFLAVQANKDRDPSWKKVIYKVICKLDEEVPELFKSPNILDHLDDVSS